MVVNQKLHYIELSTLVFDFVGLVFISIPLWTFTPPIKLTPFLGDGIHIGHSEIEGVINKIIDNFGLVGWMRFGLAILGLNMVLKFFVWRGKTSLIGMEAT